MRKHKVTPVGNPADTADVDWGAYEEYWYDALGRRVVKRSYQAGVICDWSERCRSQVDRYVWDGDQLLWEVRQNDTADVKSGPTPFRRTGENCGENGWGHLLNPEGVKSFRCGAVE